MVKKIILFVLIAALSVVLGFLTFTPNQSINVVTNWGYAVMLVTYLLFGGYLVASVRDEFKGWREQAKKRWGVLVFLSMAALFLHIHEGHEFKIVADELVISNTAMQMHYERSAGMALRAYDYAGNFTTFTSALDKRPLAFPFLLATVHDLTGYRVGNVFWLNAIIGAGLVGLLWLVGTRLGGAKAGYAAVLLMCGVPLVAQNVTGAGFELYNMTMILLTLWLGMRYAEKADPVRLGAFVLAGILLCQVRYESVLFVLPIGATVLWVWSRERKACFSPIILAAPLLMVLVPLQYNVFKVREATWQLNDVAGATSPFGLRYFYDNVGHALYFMFSFDGRQPNSWLLGALGMVATGFAVLMIYRGYRRMVQEQPGHVVTAIFIGGLLLHTALMLCYFWGKWDDPIIRRLSLPAHVLLVVAVVFVWAQLVRHRWAWEGLMVAALLHLALYATPASARHMFTQENFAAATCNWVSDYIEDHVPGTAFSIDNNAGQVWFLHRKSNINPERLSITWEGYATHFERRSFSEYLVVQRILVDQSTGERSVSLLDDFGDGLKLETVAERAFAPFYVMRISRVTGVDREKLGAWAKARHERRAEAAKKGLREVWVMDTIDKGKVGDWLKALP